MKDQILNWLQGPRIYAEGVALYREYGYNRNLKARFDRLPESEQLSAMLIEQLCQLAGITQQEIAGKPRMAIAPPAKEKPAYIDDLLMKAAAALGLTTATMFAAETLEGEEIDADTKAKIAQLAPAYAELPETIRRVINFRETFPFLSAPDCPEELKLLVTEQFAAYENYRELHRQLLESGGDMQQSEAFTTASELIENYLNNRAIWDELEHYKEHGTVLGKHPLFEQFNRKKEIAALSDLELVKKQGNARSNLTKANKGLESAATGDKKAAAKKHIEQWTATLKEVNIEIERRKKA